MLAERQLTDVLVGSTAIFFDGYLPDYKRPERLSRIRGTSSSAHNYFFATSVGIDREYYSQKPLDRDENRPLSTLSVKRRLNNLPVPSFLVPAILEALRSSSRYGPLTSLVPGEADPYCARAVKRDSGTLLTSDSDLLLYDLGPDGKVVFLPDINISGPPPPDRFVSALVYNQHSILEKMATPPSLQSLLDYAYNLKTGTHSTLAEWIARAKSPQFQPNRNNEDYHQFVTLYEETTNSLDLVTSNLLCIKVLDPRIAEFVLSVSDHGKANSMGPDDQSQRTPVFYLPQLLDRWDLGSAWVTGGHIRELAYSMCFPGLNDDRSPVVEYRRTLSTSPQGQEVYLSSGKRTVRLLRDNLSYTSRLIGDKIACPKKLQWMSLCLSIEMSGAMQEGKPSIALNLWKKAVRADYLLDPGDWDAIHLAAQIQGTLYSLRMLQQVLMCWQEGLVQGPKDIKKSNVEAMLSYLDSLPSLAEYPCAVDMTDLFQRLVSSEMPAIIELVTGIRQPTLPAKTPKKDKKQKQKQQSQKTPGRQQTLRHTSANPFDLLNAD